MKNFFILALPRSRTAWIANFLTYENSFCFHEGLMRISSVHGLKKMFSETGKKIVGNSDCGNILYVNLIKRHFDHARFVIINRDVEEVIRSLDEMEGFSDTETVYRADVTLKALRNETDALQIDYDDLGEEACRRLWDYCVGTPFDKTRWEMLDGIDMNIIPEKKVKQIQENRLNIESLMRGVH